MNNTTLDSRQITVKPFTDQPEKKQKREFERRRRSRSRSHSRSHSRSRSRSIEREPSDCKLFVGNLPYSMTWQQLKDIFGKYAKVERADIVTRKNVFLENF